MSLCTVVCIIFTKGYWNLISLFVAYEQTVHAESNNLITQTASIQDTVSQDECICVMSFPLSERQWS